MNKIRCNYCGDEIESKFTHDFKWCRCGRVAVDGGPSYLRRVYNIESDYTELSVEKQHEEN
jgi:DNA-directed RNA polymerase subunit N (RpoN/RPB10)